MEPDFLFWPLCINILLKTTFSLSLFWLIPLSIYFEQNSNCCGEVDEEEKHHQDKFVKYQKSRKLKLVVTFIFRFFHSMDDGITVSRLDLTFAESTLLLA